MTNSQSVEQDGIVAGNIFAMLNNANRGVNRMKFIFLAVACIDAMFKTYTHLWSVMESVILTVSWKRCHI